MRNKLTVNIILRSLLLWTIMIIITIFLCLLNFIIIYKPIRVRVSMISKKWGVIFTNLTKSICKVEYEVIGQENLLKSTMILASNHQSMWETCAFQKILPLHSWILKKQLQYIPFFGWTLYTLSPIAIDRSAGKTALEQISTQLPQKIADGFSILVFPEGTRVAPFDKKQYKTGAIKIAREFNLPIIPIAHNAGFVMPKKKPWVYPGKVTIIIGKPFYIDNNKSIEDNTFLLQQLIEKELHNIYKK